MEKKEKTDLTITCIDCGKDFIFEIGERTYYKKIGLFLPKRCPACRTVRKANREAR